MVSGMMCAALDHEKVGKDIQRDAGTFEGNDLTYYGGLATFESTVGTAKGSHTVTGERLVCESDTFGQFVVRAAAPNPPTTRVCDHQDSGKPMSGADMSTQLGMPAGQATPASSCTSGFSSPCMNLLNAPVGELYSGRPAAALGKD